jgi:hypothetical protein
MTRPLAAIQSCFTRFRHSTVASPAVVMSKGVCRSVGIISRMRRFLLQEECHLPAVREQAAGKGTYTFARGLAVARPAALNCASQGEMAYLLKSPPERLMMPAKRVSYTQRQAHHAASPPRARY